MKITKEYIKKMFNKPKIIGVIADVNEGKSMVTYNLIEGLRTFNTKIHVFGLRKKVAGTDEFHSVKEMEEFENSVIIVDEFFNLFNLDDRKQSRQIEQTLRLVNHRNNIIVLIGLPDNFKKYLSSKLSVILFKKCTLGSFINGSAVKNTCLDYKGYEMGTSILNIPINKCLVFDGSYEMVDIEYLREYDTKADNDKILCEKNVPNRTKKCGNEIKSNLKGGVEMAEEEKIEDVAVVEEEDEVECEDE